MTRDLTSVADVFPTLVELSGAKLPEGHTIDGKSLAATLKDENHKHRDWVFSYLGPGRLLRDERWLLIDPGLGQSVKFFDCGESRSATGYMDVTDSTDVGVGAARKRLTAILKDLPGPEGHAGLKVPAPGEEGKAKTKGKGKGKKKKAATE